jgi:hypothetical protein
VIQFGEETDQEPGTGTKSSLRWFELEMGKFFAGELPAIGSLGGIEAGSIRVARGA